ncbi:MAG: hypothetical protein LBO69_06670 [Ignavibacteria bacterium]|nr:hypothetical protein [Ignavibacteria bacterium]
MTLYTVSQCNCNGLLLIMANDNEAKNPLHLLNFLHALVAIIYVAQEILQNGRKRAKLLSLDATTIKLNSADSV